MPSFWHLNNNKKVNWRNFIEQRFEFYLANFIRQNTGSSFVPEEDYEIAVNKISSMKSLSVNHV